MFEFRQAYMSVVAILIEQCWPNGYNEGLLGG